MNEKYTVKTCATNVYVQIFFGGKLVSVYIKKCEVNTQ